MITWKTLRKAKRASGKKTEKSKRHERDVDPRKSESPSQDAREQEVRHGV